MYTIKVTGTLTKKGKGARRIDVETFETEVTCPASLSEEHRLVGLRHRILHTKFADKDFSFTGVQGLSVEDEVLVKEAKPTWVGKKPSTLDARQLQEVAAHFDLRGVPLYKRANLQAVRQRVIEEIGDDPLKYTVSGDEARRYAEKLYKARKRLVNMGVRGVGGMSLSRIEAEIRKRLEEPDIAGFNSYDGDSE